MTRIPVPADAQDIARRLYAAMEALQARLAQHYPTDPWEGTFCHCAECVIAKRQVAVIDKVRTDRGCWCGTSHQCPWHSERIAIDRDVVMAVLALADAIVAQYEVTE